MDSNPNQNKDIDYAFVSIDTNCPHGDVSFCIFNKVNNADKKLCMKNNFLINFRAVGYLYDFSFAIWEELIPLLLPAAMFFLGDISFTLFGAFEVIATWFAIIFAASFLYVINATNAGHHGAEIVHEGDEIKDLDFGIYQISATVNRIEADHNLFTTLTYFGDHTIHHMFPSLDHSLLPQLYEVFIETCIEFQEDLRKCSMIEAMIAQFQQLSRTETTKLDKKITEQNNNS